MKPPNYTETVQNRKSEGFSLRVRINNIKPKGDSQPLTVAEYSLTNEVRDSLKAALDGRENEGDPSKKESLGAIVSRHLPEPVMTDLRMFAKTKGSKTAYVMHNLPELTDEQARAVHIPHDMVMPEAYSRRIQDGITEALGLSRERPFVITRQAKHEGATGDGLHKHETAIDMLGIVLTNGATTRVTDLKSVLEASALHPDLRKLPLNCVVDDFKGVDTKVPKFEKQFGWDVRELKVKAGKHQKKWEELVQDHSQEVMLGKGSMMIWANDGHVYHQAMHSHVPEPGNDTILRIGVGGAYHRA